MRREELSVQRERYNPFYGHCCTAHEMTRMASPLSPDEMTAITRIQEFAKYHDVVFKILRGVPSMSDPSELIS
ncbi:MAG: hypothetical protein LN415_03935 [Candidatus Thermoplasmatota archaeon]|nr:hypothetical protein [Candidatus Thermoplasmatota archaeon]